MEAISLSELILVLRGESPICCLQMLVIEMLCISYLNNFTQYHTKMLMLNWNDMNYFSASIILIFLVYSF